MISDNVSWAAGEIADHPGRLGLITAVGVVVAIMIMFQNVGVPWGHAEPAAPTINNTTIIRVPGQPDRTVVRTSAPGPARQVPLQTPRQRTRSAVPRSTESSVTAAPQPRPEPVPDVSPSPSPTLTRSNTPRPTPTAEPTSSTPEPTVPPVTPSERVTPAPATEETP